MPDMKRPYGKDFAISAVGLCLCGPVTERPKVNSLAGYQSFTIHRGFESHPGLCPIPRQELALLPGFVNLAAEAAWPDTHLFYGFGACLTRRHADDEPPRTARLGAC